MVTMKIESYHPDPWGSDWMVVIKRIDGSRASESRKVKRL